MAYQIPRDGIEDGAINTTKLAIASVTADRLAGDVRKYELYSANPINSTTQIASSDVNKFVYLEHTGTDYTITLPQAALIANGSWFTFVTDGTFDGNVKATINPFLNDSAIQGTASGLSLAGNNVTVTLTLYNSVWRVVSRSRSKNVSINNASSSYDDYYAQYSASIALDFENILVFILDNGVTSQFVLPSNPVNGQTYTFMFENSEDASNYTINSNGKSIMGNPNNENLIIDVPVTSLTLTYFDNTHQWRII